MEEFDSIVIGTGTAGQTAALELAGEGHQVAVIEKSDTPGGVCALRGCQAKKWFYEAAETVARCRHLHNKGITSAPQVDWQQILHEKNAFTSAVPENTINSLRGNGIRYIRGQAAFSSPTTLRVNDTTLTARHIIIAAGAKAMHLPIEGNGYMITSDDFLELQFLPKRIAFIGGGFISFEFSHFAARLGSAKGKIHILEAGDRVLSPFDGDMVKHLLEASEAEGIMIHTDVAVRAIKKNSAGFSVAMNTSATLEVDLVVNGTGRTPDIDTLNLESAGIQYSGKGISVDARMATSNPSVFAIGDCAESLQLARVADMEAHVAARTIIAQRENGKPPAIDYSAVPAVLFTYPQLGMVGKTEEQLKEEGKKYWKSYDHHLRWPTYRRIGMKYAAYKILVDEHDLILGAHILSDNTTGLINTVKQAMIDKMPVAELHKNNIMAPYPSRESDLIYMLNPLLE